MVQFFSGQPVQNQAGLLGSALGQGLARNFEPPEQRVQRGILSQAFNDLQGAEKGDYLGQLKAIAPTLMTAPGGAELLNTLAPLLRQQAQNDAMLQGIENSFGAYAKQKGKPGFDENKVKVNQVGKQSNLEENAENTPANSRESPADKFRERPVAAGAEFGQFPQRTTGPIVQPLMNQQEMEAAAADIVKRSGGVTPWNEAVKTVVDQNRLVAENNSQIAKEQQREEDKIKERSAGVVEWAKNSHLISDEFPEEQTVIEQLAHEFRNEKTPADQREKVREAFKPFAKAREDLRREGSLPGGFSKFGRMITGNYQDKESVIKKLQPQLDQYRKYGLYDEARDLLVNDLGMGREDAEAAIFPLKEPVKKELVAFPKNKISPSIGKEQPFPGSGFNLPPEKFDKFKDEIGSILEKNPGVNLLAVRGNLNQDKKYSWQDISKAMSELIAEKRFTPDQIQQGELAEINKAPLPGLAEQFAFWWKGTK